MLLGRYSTNFANTLRSRDVVLVPADSAPSVLARVHSTSVAPDLPEPEALRALSAAFDYLRTLSDLGAPPVWRRDRW